MDFRGIRIRLPRHRDPEYRLWRYPPGSLKNGVYNQVTSLWVLYFVLGKRDL